MSKRLVEYDPLTKITTYADYNEITDTMVISSEQDVTAIIEWNKRLQSDPDRWKRGVKDGIAHYACIPNLVQEKWLNEGFNMYDKNNERALFRKLNSPEYKYLKVTEKIHF